MFSELCRSVRKQVCLHLRWLCSHNRRKCGHLLFSRWLKCSQFWWQQHVGPCSYLPATKTWMGGGCLVLPSWSVNSVLACCCMPCMQGPYACVRLGQNKSACISVEVATQGAVLSHESADAGLCFFDMEVLTQTYAATRRKHLPYHSLSLASDHCLACDRHRQSSDPASLSTFITRCLGLTWGFSFTNRRTMLEPRQTGMRLPFSKPYTDNLLSRSFIQITY